MTKVLVCGGRTYGYVDPMATKEVRAMQMDQRETVFTVLDRLNVDERITLIIQGGAKGADSVAADWAKSRCIPCLTHWASWKTAPRAAGHIRNAEMLKWEPDQVVAFPGGRGTEGMIQLAIKADVLVRIIP